MSPAGELMDASKVQEPSPEDSKLESSDLEDSQEVWTEDLNDYILETKMRQNQVAQYFWANILVSLLFSSIINYSFSLGTQFRHCFGSISTLFS
jgi:hypothetical protein